MSVLCPQMLVICCQATLISHCHFAGFARTRSSSVASDTSQTSPVDCNVLILEAEKRKIPSGVLRPELYWVCSTGIWVTTMVAGRGVIVDAVGKGVQSTLTYARDSITGLNTMLVTETSPLTVLPHT